MNGPSESLIETLKESLRHTRRAENERKARLEEVKAKDAGLSEEVERIEQEISALQTHARQTEAAIESLSEGLPNDIGLQEQ